MSKIVTIHAYSLATVGLSVKRGEITKPGTGFILQRRDQYYLVTALHMLTGRHWQTKALLSKDGFLPESFSIQLPYHKTIGPKAHGFRWLKYEICPMTVEQGASEGVAPWWVHPDNKEGIDVAVLPLSDLPKKLMDQEIALGNADPGSAVHSFDASSPPQLSTSVGDDLFIIGFPENIRTTGELPIWKRGTLASEPDLSIDELPYVLVDTGTRSGMSGSPVVRRQAAGIGSFGANSELSIFSKPVSELFGIYSGRFGADDVTSQLGIVWKRCVIDDIISRPTFGKSSLCTWLWQ